MEDVLQQIPRANQSQLGKHRMGEILYVDEGNANSMLANQTGRWDGSEET